MSNYTLSSDGLIVIKEPTAEDPRGYPIDSTMPEWETYQFWLAEGNVPVPLPASPFDAFAVQRECSRRIYEKASDNAQKNMLANFVSGTLSMAQEDAFKEGTAWIKSMQETCRALIAAQDWDYTLDNKWPVCPPASEALAQRF